MHFLTFVLKDKYVFSSNFLQAREEKGGRNTKKKGERINFLKGKKKQRKKKALKQTFLHMIKVRVNYKSFIHIRASNMGKLLLMSSLKALWILHKFRNNKRFSLNGYIYFVWIPLEKNTMLVDVSSEIRTQLSSLEKFR